MERNKKNLKERGITLVALIITIIVMLILVAVTVRIVVQSDIITTAEEAGEVYKTAHTKDQIQANNVTIEGGKYSTLAQYTCEHTFGDGGVCTKCGAVGPNMITFKIQQTPYEDDYITYYAYEGDTWEEWCEGRDDYYCNEDPYEGIPAVFFPCGNAFVDNVFGPIDQEIISGKNYGINGFMYCDCHWPESN